MVDIANELATLNIFFNVIVATFLITLLMNKFTSSVNLTDL